MTDEREQIEALILKLRCDPDYPTDDDCMELAEAIEAALSLRYQQGHDDGRTWLAHQFKMVCEQRDALLAEQQKQGDPNV